MASPAVPPSRLMLMQMKFQQKQLQERELKKTEIFSNMSKKSNEATVPNTLIGNGKVRAMFDERRRGAGIDRSQPLKPITSSGGKTTSNNSIRNNGINTAPSKVTSVKTIEGMTSTKRAIGGRDITHPVKDHDDVTDHAIVDSDLLNNNLYAGKPNKKISNSPTTSIVLAPVRTKKPILQALSPITNVSKGSTLTSATRKVVSPVKDVTRPGTKTTLKKTPVAQLTQSIAKMNLAPREITPPPGMLQCPHCRRNFLEERMDKHVAICSKLSTAKRKVFDASKHRVQGTEAEKFVKKAIRSQTKTTGTGERSSANSALKNNGWRKKREEFIAAIRAAKKVQAHLAKGGKLSDLPPPPPAENPDYIPCPHCGRRFNQSAAERHIPKCANMLHNKPKPGMAARTSLNKRR